MYVALSRVTSLDGLNLIGTFNKSAIKVDTRATQEYSKMRKNSMLQAVETVGPATDGTLIITLLNIRSFQKHQSDLVNDKALLQSDILCLTETQLTSQTEPLESLKQYNFIYNNSVDRFSSLMICCKKSCVRVIKSKNISGATLIEITKLLFSQNPIKILLLYRKNSYDRETSIYLIRHFIDESDSRIHIILGDMNINALDDDNYFAHFLSDYKQVVNEPTHISGTLIDHIYVHNDIFHETSVSSIIKSVYYSDHDAVQLKLFPNE